MPSTTERNEEREKSHNNKKSPTTHILVDSMLLTHIRVYEE